jgi:hypothetical protein
VSGRRWFHVPLLVSLLVPLLLSRTAAGSPAVADVPLPDPARDWAYQIGGASDPAPGVGTVSRDREEAPAPGAYNLCYVNAFQTQPSEKAFWRRPGHRDLVLRRGGRPVVDGGWGEWLLDTRTPAKRTRIARIVGRWIVSCARDGFDAVEPDNLDSWSRSRGLLDPADNLDLARRLAARAHRVGLAIAQKNAAEVASRGASLGFDLAVAEECGRYDECGRYAAAYDDRVLVVEYRRRDFEAACAAWGDRLPIVLRDRDVSVGGVDERC